MSLKLSPFLEFLQFFILSNDERLIQGFAIEKEVDKMKAKLEREIFWKDEEEKKEFGAEKVKWIDKTVKSLTFQKTYEKNLLRDLKTYVNGICGIADDTLDVPDYPKIFKEGKYEQMFIAGLQEMNVVTEKFHAKRGFQTVANAFFKSSVKDQMFKNGLRITEFIEYLNDNFEASIAAKDRLSDPDNYANRVEVFIKNYFS